MSGVFFYYFCSVLVSSVKPPNFGRVVMNCTPFFCNVTPFEKIDQACKINVFVVFVMPKSKLSF
jgi:hypothetical protein